MSIMRRDRAARQLNRFQSCAPTEEQQHAPTADIVSPEPSLVAANARKLHDFLIEACRAIEVVNVKARLQNALQPRHPQLTTYSIRVAPRPTSGSGPKAGPRPPIPSSL